MPAARILSREEEQKPMKAVFVLSLVIFAGLLVYYFVGMPKDSGPTLAIPIAFGAPTGGEIEMNAIIGVVLAHKSRKDERLSPTQPKSWDQWIDTHCIIKSASGQQVKLRRTVNSTIIPFPDVQATVGTEEFFLSARLKAGTAYTFDYIIDCPDPVVFRCGLPAPVAAERVRMYTFEVPKR
jgi:hypothetical protein